jgi:hypothetical protein
MRPNHIVTFIFVFSFIDYVFTSQFKRVRPNLTIASDVQMTTPLAELKKRQFFGDVIGSTCGYSNGNASAPRIAQTGYNCRIDLDNSIWGFCLTSVARATDCNFPGACFDRQDCQNGCGMVGDNVPTAFW